MSLGGIAAVFTLNTHIPQIVPILIETMQSKTEAPKIKAEDMIVYHILAYGLAITFAWLHLGLVFDWMDWLYPLIAGFQLMLLSGSALFSYLLVVLYFTFNALAELNVFLEFIKNPGLCYPMNESVNFHTEAAYVVYLVLVFVYIVLSLVAVYSLLLNKAYYVKASDTAQLEKRTP